MPLQRIISNTLKDDAVTQSKIVDLAVTDAKIDGMNASKLSGTTLPTLDGSALTSLPYDIGFIGGFDADLAPDDLEVAVYGQLVMARTGTFEGEVGVMDTAGTGSTVIVDVEKNDVSIYSTKPTFLDGEVTAQSGTITTSGFVTGDKVTFKVTQVGSGTVGQGVRFTLKCRV